MYTITRIMYLRKALIIHVNEEAINITICHLETMGTCFTYVHET